MVIYVLISFVFGTICAVLAKGKGRSALGWFLIGFFLPIIGLILILVLERPSNTYGDLVIPDGLEMNPLQVQSTISSPPMVEELERLAALHQQGALTEVEFAAQKERLFSQDQA